MSTVIKYHFIQFDSFQLVRFQSSWNQSGNKIWDLIQAIVLVTSDSPDDIDVLEKKEQEEETVG